ncbi:uncharacterized protein KQ657_004151 [Scheffersomyces spartinae]|uniref:Amino acid transporter transmembrane domain-containing protein n=1 Tax=Scheffersomyces spartinae TaxID=45513 RepID=A0A9P7VBL5_9ASCO|nr:uncharacterized protein KQ657_004151 [Scheffersomyces spartinae]KAG7195038.1 hypothetical protein KQ657_004151 [Scheffersomyces spartinae]
MLENSSEPAGQESEHSKRRRSIALLTRPALLTLPNISGKSTPGSVSNSYSNSLFLRDPLFLTRNAGNSVVLKEALNRTSGVVSRENSASPERSLSEEVVLEDDNDDNNNQQQLHISQDYDVGSNDNKDFASGLDNPNMLLQLSKHFPENIDPITLHGGDITRDLYKLGQDSKLKLKRSVSLSSSDFETSRRGSTASSLNVPGGFRREFLVNKFNKRNIQTKKPSILTRNFVEFLLVYGHFAGEELEDEDDIACHYQPFGDKIDDEESPLLLSHKIKPTLAELAEPEYINPAGTATDNKAYFLLLKAFVGTGVLFLPKAFSNGGLLFSTLTLFFFGILSYWCYLILVYAKIATKVSSFAEIGYKLYGRWLQQLILSSIILSQIGFVAAYIVFTGENFRAFVSNVSSYKVEDLKIEWFVVFQVLVLIPLSLIRDITKLLLAALLANVFIMFGLLTIIYYVGLDLVVYSLGDDIEYLFNSEKFSLFIGVAIFAFEGIGLIIPIQESMIKPNHFPVVLFKVVATISLIFIFIGSLGYLTYGNDIKTVIILNLPQDSLLIIMVQLLYAFAILLSTPIQLFPAIRLTELKLFPKLKSGKQSGTIKWLKNLFRSSFVIFTALVAMFGGQNLDRFVSFVGCFACIPLVYMYPPILHLRSCCKIESGMSAQEVSKREKLTLLNYLLIAIGAIALVYTTYEILAV